jgi:hypothetical protein
MFGHFLYAGVRVLFVQVVSGVTQCVFRFRSALGFSECFSDILLLLVACGCDFFGGFLLGSGILRLLVELLW